MSGVEHYVGAELELFAKARIWKSYLTGLIRPHLGRDVLEVGAGQGSTTAALCRGPFQRWLCLEPDARLAQSTAGMIRSGELPRFCESRVSTLRELPSEEQFDSVLYIDVLEHIADDVEELRCAAARLRPGGKLIVLAPAHQWLFSPFDRAIGHYRRYTGTSLRAVMPKELRLYELKYVDAVGLVASAGARFVFRNGTPSPWQIQLWDKGMVRLSRVVDPVLGHAIGKSVLGVWQRREERASA